MKNLLGYLAIGLIRLLGFLDLSTSQKIGRQIGKMMLARRTRAREVAKLNIQLCYPHLNANQQAKLLEDSLLHSAMTLSESGPMWGYSPEKLLGYVNEIHNENLLDNLVRQEKGILLIVPHLGNWELINTYVGIKHRLTAMYRPAKMPSFNKWMVRRRSAMGGDFVPTTKSGVLSLFSLLKKGEIVGFLPDQEPNKKFGVFALFMGVEALTPVLPHQMIQETQCNVIFAFARRLPNAQGFDIHFQAALPEQFDEDPRVSTTAMNTSIENLVAIAPEQYQWTYKRFKRRPDGSPNPYNQAGVP